MSAGSGPMAGLVLGWESGTQRGWGRARASLALLTAARSNIRCRILMEIAAPIQRKQTKRNQLLLLLLAAGAVHLLTRYFCTRTCCEANGVPAVVLLYLLTPR
ncbi:hypothetical protein MGG_15761 [Pyricularia oryzae 70-15]|uniref:Uncharacterized protein n=1 Tax=Pyricularia oryzae (strain 70-15 / ATCC MYA-4617 / FGSC 8958) TaxID=242507 RepID=G4MV97_PYRO7|nr:uncharacterized protein MGG_15761 [Pyricularia oryzae 70-15]EHA54919.1 hypothetical protein MGG_15761 [Pyricularia oryzae 70-15]